MPSSPSEKNDWLWEFENRFDKAKAEQQQQKVVIGVDGGGTKTVCVCIATPLPSSSDDLVPLSRVETGCSNYNSVGGRCSFLFLCIVRIMTLESIHLFLYDQLETLVDSYTIRHCKFGFLFDSMS